MMRNMSTWRRNVIVTVALLVAWIVLVTIEVKAGIIGPLKLVYLASIPLSLGGFVWAWLPARWSRDSTGELSTLRVAALALMATAVAVAIAIVVGVNYKIAIGGAF
jgi:hypothetical protein